MTSDQSDAEWRHTLRRQAKFIDQAKRSKTRAKRRDTYGAGSRVYQTLLMHRAQRGQCANGGCRALIPPTGYGRAMDHDPATGKPLAILCKSCSMALGNVRRRREVLIGLLDYLAAHSQK